MVWSPLAIRAETAALAWSRISELADTLQELPDSWYEAVPEWPRMKASWDAGHAGVSLFYAYCHRATGQPQHLDLALYHADRAIEAIGALRMLAGLTLGVTGTAWAIEHLSRVLPDALDDDPNVEADEFVLTLLNSNMAGWLGGPHYDLMFGLVGFGMYGLERSSRGAGKECVSKVVHLLASRAEMGPHGTAWFTRGETVPSMQRAGYTDGFYNLGVAHGQPGVIAFLGLAHRAGIEKPLTSELLHGAVRWLFTQMVPRAGGPCFPSFVATGKAPTIPTVGWCYGDLGLAAALLLAARCVADKELEARAVEIATAMSNRPVAGPQRKTVDISICHGAAGAVHIFNRLFRATGRAGFGEAATRWLDAESERRIHAYVSSLG